MSRHNLHDGVSLKAQRCDEDVDEDCEEDKYCRYVVHRVQLGMFPRVIQIILHCWHRKAQRIKNKISNRRKTELTVKKTCFYLKNKTSDVGFRREGGLY